MTEPLSFLGQSGPYSTLRRSAVDPITGNATLGPLGSGDPNEIVWRGGLLPVGRTRDGRTVPAGSQLGKGLVDLVSSIPDIVPEGIKTIDTAGRMMRGEIPMHDEDGRPSLQAIGTALGAAGLAATGSLPFSAPKGALRSFGGREAESAALGGAGDDLLASLEASIAKSPASAPPPRAGRVDPSAKSWDLYHGSAAGPDFERFDPSRGVKHSESGALYLAPDAETANFYASGGSGGAEAGPRVFRTRVDPGKTHVFDLPEMIANDPAFTERARAAMLAEKTGATPAQAKAYDDLRESWRSDFLSGRARDQDINKQLAEMGMEPSAATLATYGHGYGGAAVQMAREMGLDTAVVRGLAEHGGADQVIALTPNRVRSFYAPDQLLYGLGGLGLGAAAYGAPDPAQAAPLAALGQAYYGPPAR